MRILVVLSFYAPHWTGLTKYAQRAAEGWAALGDQVTVVCSQHDRTSAVDEVINEVRVVRCPTLLPISRAVVAPLFVPTIARLIPLHDVVIIHTPLPEARLVGWLCQRSHVPYTCVHHGDVVLPQGLHNRLYTSLMHHSALHAFAHADAICTHSTDYADHSQWLAPVRWRVRVITPPVTIVPTRGAGARLIYGIPADAFVVGIGGRMVHEKGFDRVFAHLERLKQTFPSLILLHVGALQMPYEPAPDTPKGVFRSLGLLRDDDAMAAFFACCDVVLLPSRSDCFPSFAV
jgi:glycosyltransferase involved in cell wall biosynthesis